MAVLMFLFGIYFYKSKGKAARFLSGYNMKSEEERKNMMKTLCVRHMEKNDGYVFAVHCRNNHRYSISRNRLLDCMDDMAYYVYFIAY